MTTLKALMALLILCIFAYLFVRSRRLLQLDAQKESSIDPRVTCILGEEAVFQFAVRVNHDGRVHPQGAYRLEIGQTALMITPVGATARRMLPTWGFRAADLGPVDFGVHARMGWKPGLVPAIMLRYRDDMGEHRLFVRAENMHDLRACIERLIAF